MDGHNNNENGCSRGISSTIRKSSVVNSDAFNLSTLPQELRMSGKKKLSKVFNSATCVINRLLSEDTLDSLTQIEVEEALGSADYQTKLEAILKQAEPNKMSAVIKVALQKGNHQLAAETLAALDPIRNHGYHYKLLHFAVKINDHAFCQTLITQFQLSPNDYYKGGKETAVHVAAKQGHLSLLRYLHQEAKGDLNASQDPKDPWTPLMVAAQANHVHIIHYLLENKVAISPISFSATPLHVAAQNNHADCIKTILEGGAMVDPLYCPKKRETPLHVACAHGFYQSAAVLLDYKADPDAANGQGETSLHLACKGLQSDLINLLLEHDATITARDDEDRTPLHFLLNSKLGGKLECIEILFKSIANNEVLYKRKTDIINLADKQGWTPLHYAAYNGRTKSLQFLIENKADLGLKNKSGQSGLQFAVKYLPGPTIEAIGSMLDKSIQCGSLDSPDGDLVLSFDSIAPPQSSTSVIRSNVQVFHELLPLIEQGSQKSKVAEVLLHPISQCYLHLKWSQMQRFYYFILFCHLVYSACYTAYSILIYKDMCPHIKNHAKTLNCALDEASDGKKKTTAQVLWTFMIFFTIIYLLTEVTKIVSDIRFRGKKRIHRDKIIQILSYFFDMEIFFNWLAIVSFVIIGLPSCPFQSQLTLLPWQYVFNGIGLFVIWLLMLLLMARVPKLGIFIEIFKNVSLKFLEFLMAFGSLFLAFLFTFIVYFPDRPWNQGAGAVVKMLSMTLGELTYDEHVKDLEDEDGDGDGDGTHFPFWGGLLFTMFLFMMSVVVVNLLFGLAVNETQELFKQAQLRQLVQQVKMTHFIEDTSFRLVQFKFIPEFAKQIIWRYTKSSRQLTLPINGNEKMAIPSSLFGVVKQKVLDMKSTKESSIVNHLQDLQVQMKQLADKLDKFMLESSIENTEGRQTH